MCIRDSSFIQQEKYSSLTIHIEPFKYIPYIMYFHTTCCTIHNNLMLFFYELFYWRYFISMIYNLLSHCHNCNTYSKDCSQYDCQLQILSLIHILQSTHIFFSGVRWAVLRKNHRDMSALPFLPSFITLDRLTQLHTWCQVFFLDSLSKTLKSLL